MKKLFDFADVLEKEGLVSERPSCDADIDYISYTSADIKENTLFIRKGAGFKEEYLKDAASKGAVAYISETKYNVELPCILVNDALNAMSAAAAFYYDCPQNKLKLVSVTGTKGKSTTSCYLKAILDCWLLETTGKKASLISSIDTDDGVDFFESHLTTPEGLDLHRNLYNTVKSGREYCIVECSSQALKYGRVRGLTFECAGFLNISEDHISPKEHSDLEDYFSAKLKIFSHSKSAVINGQCDMFERVKAEAEKCENGYTVFSSADKADIYAENIKGGGVNQTFDLIENGGRYRIELPMPGIFNVDNALCAIGICRRLGVPMEYIQKGLKNARAKGRMEVFASADMAKIVIVDYAHNYLSMGALFDSVEKQYKGREVSIVFGCPGGKAFTRRRDLGMLAGIHADRIYLTMEDPDHENVRDISEDIARYAERNCDEIHFIDDRTEAIRRAIFESSRNAVILLTAKGRETRQKIKGRYEECASDVELAEAFLALYDKVGAKLYTR